MAYIAKLGLRPKFTNLSAWKIDSLPLEIYGMASASFSLKDSLKKIWFFEETFLLADTSIEIVLRISFLVFNNINFEFTELG